MTGQIVGLTCQRCGQRISLAMEAAFCPRCGRPAHTYGCSPSAARPTARACANCGADTDAPIDSNLSAPLVVPRTRSVPTPPLGNVGPGSAADPEVNSIVLARLWGPEGRQSPRERSPESSAPSPPAPTAGRLLRKRLGNAGGMLIWALGCFVVALLGVWASNATKWAIIGYVAIAFAVFGGITLLSIPYMLLTGREFSLAVRRRYFCPKCSREIHFLGEGEAGTCNGCGAPVMIRDHG